MKLGQLVSPKRPFLQWLFGWLRPFFWFYWQPAGWEKWLTTVDPALPPLFNPLQLKPIHWYQSNLRYLLIDCFIVGPSLMALLAIFLLGHEVEWIGVGFGLVMGLFLGIGYALLISMASGLIGAIVGTVAFCLILGSRDIILIDILWQPRLGVALGLCTAVLVSCLIDPQPALTRYSRYQQLGSFLVGLLVSAFVLALTAGVSMFITTRWQQGSLGVVATVTVIGFAPFGILAIGAGFAGRSWKRGVWGAAIIVLLVVILTATFFRSVDFNRDLYGRPLLHVNILLITTGYLMMISLPYALANWLGGPWAARTAVVIGSLVIHVAYGSVFTWYDVWQNFGVHLIFVLLGITILWWRPLVAYPFQSGWSLLLIRLEAYRKQPKSSLLRYQAVYWDVYQFLPIIGLVEHILLVAKLFPEELEDAISYIALSKQRELARIAQIEIEAQDLKLLDTLEAIAACHEHLSATLPTDPAGALLRSFRHVSLDVAAALSQRSSYNQRLALTATGDRLNGLVRELTRSTEPYALQFRPIAHQWHEIIVSKVEQLTALVAVRKEIEDPYIIGIPLTATQEIFVGRETISQRIEQLLLDGRHPPVLLYGQRRMGKTSLLNNMGRLLPQRIFPLFVDLQGPVAFAADHAGLLYNLARGMQRSAYDQRGVLLPELPRPDFSADAFTAFDLWLDAVEKCLLTTPDSQILLMLDEFEALDAALQMGRFTEALVLGMIRHVIQHRQRIKVLLAGSHTLDEFRRWSGYLLNAQVLHLSCLEVEEARQLILNPIPNFPLRYDEDATQRVFSLTYGHPFLLQLLCSEIIALKNNQPLPERFAVVVADVETAVPSALQRGTLFFADIEVNQLRPEEVQFLRQLSQKGEGFMIEKGSAVALPGFSSPDEVLSNLLLREILRETAVGYQFHNEMIRRWFLREQLWR